MKKRKLAGLAIGIFMFGASATTSTHASLVSTFDTGSEGWSIEGSAENFTWMDSGGNPFGHIRADDIPMPTPNWYFISPDNWDGDWRQYIGGTLSYDFNLIYKDGDFAEVNYINLVRISSFTDEISYNFSSHIEFPVGIWQTFEIQLSAVSFGVDAVTFSNIMSNVTSLKIIGEYTSGPDTGGLDNVNVNPIPIPGTLWLLGPCLAGLVGVRIRKRRN